MLHIGGNNLKATPKRTFFSFTGMVLLALASIYACYSFFSASFEEPTRQNNYTGTYESRELVAVSSPNGYITQSDIDAIMSDKRAVCVLNDTTLSYYLNYVDLSAYLEYKKSGLISYDDTSAVDMTLNCSHILSKVDEGRLPEHSGEIALIIQSNPTKNDLLGKTLTFYDYSYYPDAESYNSATNFYGTLPTHSFVVTGIKYAESFAAYIVHDDFVAISTDYYGWHYENPDTTSHVEANGKENLSYVYVRFYPDKTNVNSLTSALKAKGFKCYYPYGLQSHTLTLQLLVALLYIAGITILLLIVLVVTSGAQRSVSDLKRREYGIMRTVGIKGSMLSKMYLTEQWILAFFAHIAGGVIFTAIQIGTLFWGRQSGVIITLLLLKTTFTPILKSFIVGFFLTMIFAAIIVGRFNKKFYNNTVKTALTETEALV